MGIYVFGAGGFGREVVGLARDVDRFRQQDSAPSFVVDDAYFDAAEIAGIHVLRRSEWTPALGEVTVAVGDPTARRKIVAGLPPETRFATLIHPSAVIGNDVALGPGAIVTAGCILTCNIRIGAHAHLNLQSTVGHDCEIGDYFTTAPGVKISGSCRIGEAVYIGTNASVREKVAIAGGAVVGMGAAVVRNITEPGIYIGVPAVRQAAGP